MKKINSILRKCKTLSRQLSRSSSYSSLRSKSTRNLGRYRYHDQEDDEKINDEVACETIFVGSSRRRYVISSKHLTHPLLSALIERSKNETGPGPDPGLVSVKCEVVLFDHLLWMLENADPTDSLEELAELYMFTERN